MKSKFIHMKTFALIIILFAVNIFSQAIPIDSVRRQDANGVPLLLGQTVTVRGVVTMSAELGTPLVYFQDPTGGMVAYDAVFWGGTNAGDDSKQEGCQDHLGGEHAERDNDDERERHKKAHRRGERRSELA